MIDCLLAALLTPPISSSGERLDVRKLWVTMPQNVLIEQLKKGEAIAEADTSLLTVPNQLDMVCNAHVIEAILTHVAPASDGANEAAKHS